MRRFSVLLTIAALAATVLLPASAFAVAASTTVPAAAVVPSADCAVQFWLEGSPGQTIAIVSLALPKGTKLPATVRIPVPQGYSIEWAGEVSGTGVENDIERKYTIEKGKGGDYVQFVVEKYLEAQIDASGPGPVADGTKRTLSASFAQSVPASLTGFSVRFPAGISSVAIKPAPAGAPESNSAGETLYTLPNKQMKVGESAAIEVSYDTAPAAASTSGSGSTRTIIGVLLGALAVAVVVLVIAIGRQRAAGEVVRMPQQSTRMTRERGAPSTEPTVDERDDAFLIDD